MIVGICAVLLLIAIIVVVIVTTRKSDDGDSGHSKKKHGGGTAEERVQEILKRVPLIDGHNDLPWQLRTQFKNQLAKVMA